MLKDACNIENQHFVTKSDNNKNCDNYNLAHSSFKGIEHKDGSVYGGALSLQSISTVSLIDNTFENILAWYYGGAIYLYIINNKADLINNTFTNCKSDWSGYHGGTLYFHTVANANVRGNQITDTGCKNHGGSIYFEKTPNIEIISNLFNQSQCGNDGGACYIYYHTKLDIKDNHFLECKATGSVVSNSGGAIYIVATAAVLLERNTIENSYTDNYGGAIAFKSISSIDMIDNKYIGTYTLLTPKTSSYGGAIYLDGISTTVKVSGDNFTGCYARDYGCTLYVSGPSSLNMNFNNISIDKCFTTGSKCGAFYINNINNIIIDGIQCNECRTNDNGGAIDIGSAKKIEISNGKFRCCNATSKGGAIYFPGSIPSNLTNVAFSCCKANVGGALYYDYYYSPVILKYVSFDNCQSDSDGGAIYAYYSPSVEIEFGTFVNCSSTSGNGGGLFASFSSKIVIHSSNFEGCSSKSKSGGGVYIGDNTLPVSFKNNNFTSCTSAIDGSAVGIFCTLNEYVSENNVFIDCEGGKSGALCIKSTFMNGVNPDFKNDQYINCSAQEGGEAGAVFFNVVSSTNFDFHTCSFKRCSGTAAGTISFNIASSSAQVTITVLGCDFTDCSSNYAACIHIVSNPTSSVILKITYFGPTRTTFSSMLGKGVDNYVISADVNTISLTKCDFIQLYSISAFNTTSKCKTIALNDCNFNSCKPTGNIIKSVSLDTFTMENTAFKECQNCFQIDSNKMTLTSITFSGINEQTTASSLSGNEITATDFNIYNSKENLKISSNKFLFNNGKFENFSKYILISKYIKEAVNPTSIVVDNLTSVNAQMFSVDTSIASFSITKSEGSYINTDPNSILTSSATKTDISYCNFSRKDALSLVLSGTSATMSFCYVFGDGTLKSCIEVSTKLTLINSTFISENRPIFDINALKGQVVLFKDSNCINKPFNDTFTGSFNVVDQNENKINRFLYQNNHCRDETPPSSQFTHSQLFRATEYFSISEQMSETNIFTHSKAFSESNALSNSNAFKETDQMSHSNHFVLTQNFSVSQSFLTLDKETSTKENVLTSIYPDIKSSLFKDPSPKQISNTYKSETKIIEGKETYSLHPSLAEHATTLIQHESNTRNTQVHGTTSNPLEKHQSSSNEHNQPSSLELNHQPSSIISLPSSSDNKPSPSDNQPSPSDNQPSSIINQQSSNKHIEDIMTSQYPRAKSEKLTSLKQIESQIKSPIPTDNYVTSQYHISSKASHHKSNEHSSIKQNKETTERSIENEKAANKSAELAFDQANAMVEQPNHSSTGMVAGVAAGVIVLIIIVLIIIYILVIKKKKQTDEDFDEMDAETDLESSTLSTENYDDYGTTYVTQENTNTMWTAGDQGVDFRLIDDDFEETDHYN